MIAFGLRSVDHLLESTVVSKKNALRIPMQNVSHTSRRRAGTFKSARRRTPPVAAPPSDAPLTVRGLAKRMHPRSAQPPRGRAPSSAPRRGPGGEGAPAGPGGRRNTHLENLESVRSELMQSMRGMMDDMTGRLDRVHQVLARCTVASDVYETPGGGVQSEPIRPGTILLLSTYQVEHEGRVLCHMYHVDAMTGQTGSRYVVAHDSEGHHFEFLNSLPADSG